MLHPNSLTGLSFDAVRLLKAYSWKNEILGWQEENPEGKLPGWYLIALEPHLVTQSKANV